MADSRAALRLLIIGGSGFVSGTLAQAARAQGHRVWTLTRGQRPVTAGVTALRADRRDPAAFAGAIASAGTDWDVVVDCIGYAEEDAQQDLASFRDRAGHLIFISTDFVYDPARRRFPQPEEPAEYLAAGYGGNKRRCELELIRAGRALPWTVLRPCHIYGPGSQLGCLPRHGRDAQLMARLRAGEPLHLVGGGHFLQQPIFARDLAQLVLSAAGNARAFQQIFNAAGPDILESRRYYQIVAEALGLEARIEEVPVAEHLAAHPEAAPFLCHRIYDLTRLGEAGLDAPATPIEHGLREQVTSVNASTVI